VPGVSAFDMPPSSGLDRRFVSFVGDLAGEVTFGQGLAGGGPSSLSLSRVGTLVVNSASPVQVPGMGWWQVRPVRQRKITPCPSAARSMIDGSWWPLSRPLVAIDHAIDHEKVMLRTAR
jgi:hypothetical protein